MFPTSNSQSQPAAPLPEDDFISRLLAETAHVVNNPASGANTPKAVPTQAPPPPPLPTTGPLDIETLLSSPQPVLVPPPPTFSPPLAPPIVAAPVANSTGFAAPLITAPASLSEIEVDESNQSRTRCKSCQQPFPISKVFEVKRVQYSMTQFNEDYCAACTEKLKQDYRREITFDNKSIIMALALGLVASLVAGVVLGAAMASVRRYYQPIALAMGGVVAYAMIYGSGKKRGLPLMLLAAAMTIPGLILSVYVQYWIDFSPSLSLLSISQFTRYLQAFPLYISDYIAFVLAFVAAFCVPLAPDLYVTPYKGKPEKIAKKVA